MIGCSKVSGFQVCFLPISGPSPRVGALIFFLSRVELELARKIKQIRARNRRKGLGRAKARHVAGEHDLRGGATVEKNGAAKTGLGAAFEQRRTLPASAGDKIIHERPLGRLAGSVHRLEEPVKCFAAQHLDTQHLGFLSFLRNELLCLPALPGMSAQGRSKRKWEQQWQSTSGF